MLKPVDALLIIDAQQGLLDGKAAIPNARVIVDRIAALLAAARSAEALKEINPKIVQEQLGHASIHLTLNTYSHVIKSMRGIAANALEEVVGSD